MKNRLIDSIAGYIFYTSILLLMIINFTSLELKIKQIISPIAITLFGLSMSLILFSGFLDLKIKDFEYFRSILIGIFGGLTVWLFSTINFKFPNGIILGINNVLLKLGFGIMVLLIGYKICGRDGKINKEVEDL